LPWYLSGGVPLANCIAAYQPEGADSLVDSYVNLANPGTNNATPGNAPAWSAINGWIFDTNLSKYLDTGIIPVTGMSAIVKFSNVGNVDSYLFGSKTGTGQSFQIVPSLSGTNNVRYGNGGEITKTPPLTEGVLAFAGTKAYRNGVEDATIGVWSGTSTHSINIGRLNRASPAGYISAYIKAIAFYNTILTQSQITAIYEAIVSPFSPTPVESGEFMLVHMTDTHYQDAEAAVIHNQMSQYIADHAVALGIEVVLHGGDVIYPPLDQAAQYVVFDAMFDILDAANIPYMVTIGNHDYDGDNASDVIGRESTGFNGVFSQARYTAHDWWGGGFFEVGKTENAYLLRSIGGVDWLFITMEFGPRSAVLAWADGLLTTYSARHAIILTHSHIHRDGTTVAAGDQYAPHPDYTLDGLQNNGDEVLTALKSHDNIRLFLSGHDKGTIGWCAANRADNSDGGVPINQMVANYQSMYGYASGMMRFIRINPTAKTIKVQTYSPRLNMFMHDAGNEFTVDWEP